MANVRIADLPSATMIDDNTYLAIDSYNVEGTSKATPMQVCSVLITSDELIELENKLNNITGNRGGE